MELDIVVVCSPAMWPALVSPLTELDMPAGCVLLDGSPLMVLGPLARPLLTAEWPPRLEAG